MANEQGPVRGVDFITAPQVRSSRTRYTKTPLVRPARGFFAWLRNLFNRRPRPFIGSPIAAEIDEGLGFSAAVLSGDAPRPLTRKSTIVESVAARLLGYFQESTTRTDNALDAIDDNLLQEELWLDQCRPDNIVRALHGSLTQAEQETTGHLRTFSRVLVRARDGYEKFRHRHDLDDDAKHGKHLDFSVLGQLGVLIVLEFILNSFFQGSLMKGGLLDGALFALFTSMATVIVGLVIGIGNYLRKQTLARGGWFGWFTILIGVLAAFFLISELSLIRLAGDAGNLDALQTSVRQMKANQFAGVDALLELPALAYSIFLCFLIGLVAFDFRRYWGSYPGLWEHGLKLEDVKGKIEALIVAAQAEIQQLGDFHNERLQKAPDFIVSCKAPIRTLAADHENAIDQYHLDVSDVTAAARLFDCFIGEHGGTNDGELERLLEQPIAAFGDKLAKRHEAFRAKVDELCAREDVSDISIEEAQEEFSAELDKASTKLDEIRASEQQRSREMYRVDAKWDLSDPIPAAE